MHSLNPPVAFTDRKNPWFLRLTWIPAVVMLAVSGVGILHPEIYAGFGSDRLLAAGYGQDLASFVVSVFMICTAVFSKPGASGGRIALLGSLLYVFYAYSLFAFGAVYNHFFFFYLALVGLSVYLFLGGLLETPAPDGRELPGPKFPEKTAGIFLIFTGVLIAAVWVILLGNTIFRRAPATGINTVFVLDLAVVLPGFVMTGAGLLQKKKWSYLLSGALLVFICELGFSILLGDLSIILRGLDAAIGPLLLFSGITLGGCCLAASYFRRK